MTAHINAKKGEIAKTVIMAGDPLRAKKMAEEILKDYKLVSNVRGMSAFTGTYNGKEVTVMGHGMGPSSASIYMHELYKFYDVDRIVRVGSGGSINKDIKIMDIVVGVNAHTNSTNFGVAYGNNSEIIPASENLVKLAKEKSAGVENIKFADILSSQWFYTPELPGDAWKEDAEKGIHLVEMEAHTLYLIANYFNKEAIALITCSDSYITGEALSPEDRQNTFNQMLKFAIDTYV